MAETKHRNVSRIDQPEKKHHGWFVRVSSEGRVLSKFFGDRVHGSRAKALRAAVTHRDELLRELGRTTERPTPPSRTRRNTSGIVGVALREVVGADGRVRSKSWVATWCPKPGRIARKSFSVAKFGNRDALLMACAFRRDREREIYGSEIRENWAAAAKILLKL